MTATIFDIKEFAIRDGPGGRTTVFFKGCPLRCRWCHNPEGLSPLPQLMVKEAKCTRCGLCRRPCGHEECRPFGRCLHVCPNGCISVSGRTWSAPELAARLLRDRPLWERTGGGVSFSGGEPLLQWEFLMELIPLLEGANTALETSGFAPADVFRRVIGKMDYVMMDVKLADEKAHRAWTGVSNRQILENLRVLQESGVPHELRTPLIPGVTDTPENLEAVRVLVGDSPWKTLPYNTLAGAKYPMLGMTYPMDAPAADSTDQERI